MTVTFSLSVVQVTLMDEIVRCRYEFKYVISESMAAAVEHFIQPYIKLDPYCEKHSERSYPIVSLYMDSVNFNLCRQTLEGRKNRFKLRIRGYSDAVTEPRYFEIKRRLNSVIIKSRTEVERHNVINALSALELPDNGNGQDGDILSQFQFYAKQIGACPVLKVRYLRRAYEDENPNRVRITFDRQLAYQVTNKAHISFNGGNWHQHHSRNVILEIKFTGCYPAWLSRMVRGFNLQRQSFSKYVTSIKHSCTMGFCAPRLTV